MMLSTVELLEGESKRRIMGLPLANFLLMSVGTTIIEAVRACRCISLIAGFLLKDESPIMHAFKNSFLLASVV